MELHRITFLSHFLLIMHLHNVANSLFCHLFRISNFWTWKTLESSGISIIFLREDQTYSWRVGERDYIERLWTPTVKRHLKRPKGQFSGFPFLIVLLQCSYIGYLSMIIDIAFSYEMEEVPLLLLTLKLSFAISESCICFIVSYWTFCSKTFWKQYSTTKKLFECNFIIFQYYKYFFKNIKRFVTLCLEELVVPKKAYIASVSIPYYVSGLSGVSGRNQLGGYSINSISSKIKLLI